MYCTCFLSLLFFYLSPLVPPPNKSWARSWSCSCCILDNNTEKNVGNKRASMSWSVMIGVFFKTFLTFQVMDWHVNLIFVKDRLRDDGGDKEDKEQRQYIAFVTYTGPIYQFWFWEQCSDMASLVRIQRFVGVSMWCGQDVNTNIKAWCLIVVVFEVLTRSFIFSKLPFLSVNTLLYLVPVPW